MAIINISVKKSENPLDKNKEGWTASIATVQENQETGMGVSVGESLIYNTKQEAWLTIRDRAAALDYEKNDVRINGVHANNFNEVEQHVNALQ